MSGNRAGRRWEGRTSCFPCWVELGVNMLPKRQVWHTSLAYRVLVPSHGSQESCLSLIAASLKGGAVSLPAIPLTFASFPQGYFNVPRCPTRKWVSSWRLPSSPPTILTWSPSSVNTQALNPSTSLLAPECRPLSSQGPTVRTEKTL